MWGNNDDTHANDCHDDDDDDDDTYVACETSSLFQEQNRETASKLGRATLVMFTLPPMSSMML